MKTDSVSNQLRWVVLLLAAAVILPTVCLLWFMNQAVRNERLAVRQKLIDVYREKTAPLLEHLEQKRLQFEQDLERIKILDPYSFFVDYCFEREHADTLLIYDDEGQVLFPIPSENARIIDTQYFEKAWQLEFIVKNYLEAASEYERIIATISNPHVVREGQSAMIRCYEKGGIIKKAIELCRELAYPGEHIANEYSASETVLARLKLIQLYHNHDSAMFQKEVEQLLSDLVSITYKQLPPYKKPLPSEVRIFVLGKLLALVEQTQLVQQQPEIITKAHFILNAESLSLEALELFHKDPIWTSWPEKSLETLGLKEKAYGSLFKVNNKNIIFIVQRKSIVRVMTYIAEKLSDSTVAVGVFDEQDNMAFGKNNNPENAFLTIKPSEYLGDWRLCFFFRNSGVFDRAANKQATIYFWTGILVALLILAAGAVSIRAVNQQIKMNRLKNDFIATVTHELKTPLASMRLLVDTLLEGNYEGEQTATEYLQLVANENKRLTHLIDSFLTFSRMERNKQVFDFHPVRPADIAAAAVEAIGAKFKGSTGLQPVNHGQDGHATKNGCEFSANIAENLPLISADKDGMVTVLVNLLDNAYKYSNGEKQIELNVVEQNGRICFAVKDNGIGLSPRAQRKIFNRFYQVDSRLSRRAEGCGLGLSIVKFIVDAHKGTIEVESKAGEGSVFTVKLPTV